MGQIIRCPLNGLSCGMAITLEEDSFFLAEAEKPEDERQWRREALTTVLEREYQYKIKSALDESDINAFTCKICKLIQNCAYGIADITSDNPNVLLELGMMIALGKPTVILVKRGQEEKLKLPSDIIDREVIPFQDYTEIMPKLRKVMENLPLPLSPPSPIQALERLQPQFTDELKKMVDDIVKEFKESIEEAKLERVSPREKRKEILPELAERLRSSEEKLEEMRRLGFVTDAETAFFRGNYFYDEGKYVDALASYSWSLELSPDAPDTLTNRGTAYAELGRHDPEALTDFNRSLELRANDTDTLNNRGVSYAELGRYDEALDDFNRCLELSPDDPYTPYNLACLFSLWDKAEESIAYLKKAIELNRGWREDAKKDKDFNNIRDDPRFKKLMETD